MNPYRFHPAARDELFAAVDWYAQRDPIVAAAFAQVAEMAIMEIAAIPMAWPTWTGGTDLRRRVLRRFPYSIVYLPEDGAIVILAVAHHARRPGYWVTRVVSRQPEE